MRQMFVDPVTQQAMDIDIDTQIDQFDWLLVTIPDLVLFSSVEKLIQHSIHKVDDASMSLSYVFPPIISLVDDYGYIYPAIFFAVCSCFIWLISRDVSILL